MGKLFGIVFIYLSASLVLTLNATTLPAHGIALHKLSHPERIDSQWRHHLCNGLEQKNSGNSSSAHVAMDCQSLNLYQSSGDPSGDYYVIGQPLVIAKAHFSSASFWRVERLWILSAFQPDHPVEGDGDGEPPSIYPALYPVDASHWAVAITYGWSEMYSGGGGSFSLADMVVLSVADQPQSLKPIIAAMPFSCSKDIRGCFSKDEYDHSPHCSEDFEGSLQIQYARSSLAGAYRWTGVWHESHWPADVPKSKSIQRVSRAQLLPAATPDAVGTRLRDRIDFCEPLN